MPASDVGGDEVPPALQRASGTARHKDRKIVMVVLVAVANRRAVAEHHVVEQRALTLLGRRHSLEHAGKERHMVGVDPHQLRVVFRLASVM